VEKVLSTAEEINQATNLPVGYDNIPRLDEADDGLGNSAVRLMIRPTVECGMEPSFTTAQRLRDCATKNPAYSEWKGLVNGNAGEGNWKLLARNSSGREVWLDESTGLFWSDVVATSNWCQASGNTEPSLINDGIDCNVIGAGVSRCESAAVLGLPAADIAWRLPTRGDFLQADLNGARFVLPRTTTQVWTATLAGDNREQAWSITVQTGVLSKVARDQSLGIRCVGRRQR
jgi:hypothetical protein